MKVNQEEVEEVLEELESFGVVAGERSAELIARATREVIGDTIQRRGGRVIAGFGGMPRRHGVASNAQYSDGSAMDASGRGIEVLIVDTAPDGGVAEHDAERARQVAECSGLPVLCIPGTSPSTCRAAGRELVLFGDSDELKAVFAALNGAGPFFIAETLSDTNAPLVNFKDACELAGFVGGEQRVFLVADASVVVLVSDIHLADGSGVKTKVSQLFNPDAVLIRLGGTSRDGLILATTVTTTAETETARRTFAAIESVLVAASRPGDGCHVMPGAMEKLRAGWRLAQGPDYSPNADLVLSAIESADA